MGRERGRYAVEVKVVSSAKILVRSASPFSPGIVLEKCSTAFDKGKVRNGGKKWERLERVMKERKGTNSIERRRERMHYRVRVSGSVKVEVRLGKGLK